MLLETLMNDPDSGQKAFPQQSEGFLVFFGARGRTVGGLGRLTIGSSRSRTLVGQATQLTLIVGSAGLLDPPFHRRVGLKAIE